MEKNNVYMNIFGGFLLVFFACEYLFSLGDISINIYFGLLLLLFLYLAIFKLGKLKYIPIDCILSFLILPLISYALFFMIEKMGFQYNCDSKYCLNDSRSNYFIILNVITSMFFVVVNMVMYVIRFVVFKKKSS